MKVKLSQSMYGVDFPGAVVDIPGLEEVPASCMYFAVTGAAHKPFCGKKIDGVPCPCDKWTLRMLWRVEEISE